jgi:hypothetical protein
MVDARVRELGAGMKEDVNWSSGPLGSWPEAEFRIADLWPTCQFASWPVDR